MDETGILTVEETGSTERLKKGRFYYYLVKSVSVICAMGVACILMPPMFIYPQQRMTTLLENMALLVQSTYVPNLGGLMRNYS